jgi:hypothetical protein
VPWPAAYHTRPVVVTRSPTRDLDRTPQVEPGNASSEALDEAPPDAPTGARGGLIAPHEHDPGPARTPLERRRERHGQQEHPPATADDVLSALRCRFVEHRVDRVPWLFYYWTGRLPQDARGAEVARTVLRLEPDALAAGALAPLGLRVVSARRDASEALPGRRG